MKRGSKQTEQPTTIADRLLGGVGGGMLIAALVVLVMGGPGDGSESVAEAPPALELISPIDGATLEPLRLEFRVPGESLTWTPGGWGVAGLHVHAEIDGTEVMPGRTDLRPTGAGEYEWLLNDVPNGEFGVRLLWSDAQHRPVLDGASRVVRIRVGASSEP